MKVNELASEIKKTIKALKTHAVMSNTILRIEAEHYEETACNNLKELERLAKIGIATEKFCESYGGTTSFHFENIEDLINWAESGELLSCLQVESEVE